MTDKNYEGLGIKNLKASVERFTSALQRGTRKSKESVMLEEALLQASRKSMQEYKEFADLVRQIEASRKRSQKTQRETAKLRKRNQVLLAKL